MKHVSASAPLLCCMSPSTLASTPNASATVFTSDGWCAIVSCVSAALAGAAAGHQGYHGCEGRWVSSPWHTGLRPLPHSATSESLCVFATSLCVCCCRTALHVLAEINMIVFYGKKECHCHCSVREEITANCNLFSMYPNDQFFSPHTLQPHESSNTPNPPTFNNPLTTGANISTAFSHKTKVCVMGAFSV